MTHKVLAIDDEPSNLRLIKGFLEEEDLDITTVNSGYEGLSLLEKNKGGFDVVLLDRMMPKMSGIEFMSKIKKSPGLKNIPVIMQTAAVDAAQVAEGVNAGVFYYLPKPYDEERLVNIVNAAILANDKRKALNHELQAHRNMLGVVLETQARFQTLEQASDLAVYLANLFPEPEKVVFGLSELMINAVEHGNLGITYNDKTKLEHHEIWQLEVKKRLEKLENKGKWARAYYYLDHSKQLITVKITDEGTGFKWDKYLTIDPKRGMDTHGRGIAVAKSLSFDSLEYQGVGNEVVCTVKL